MNKKIIRDASQPSYPTKAEIKSSIVAKGAAVASLATLMSVTAAKCGANVDVVGDVPYQAPTTTEEETVVGDIAYTESTDDTECTESECTESSNEEDYVMGDVYATESTSEEEYILSGDVADVESGS